MISLSFDLTAFVLGHTVGLHLRSSQPGRSYQGETMYNKLQVLV